MLRFQQYIELVRTKEPTKLVESIIHAKKFLLPYKDSYPKEVQQACGLLAFPPGARSSAYGVSSFVLSAKSSDFCRNFIANFVGQLLRTSLCKHTTTCSHSPRYHSSISLSPPDYQRSKHRLATPHIYPPSRRPHPLQSQLPFALSVAQSLTIWHETFHTLIILRVMLSLTWYCYRMAAYMDDSDFRSTAGKREWMKT
jgi:hypothetical protein